MPIYSNINIIFKIKIMDEEVINDLLDEVMLYSSIIVNVGKYSIDDCKSLVNTIRKTIQDAIEKENDKFKIL